jgi:hypothetical protein
MQTATKFDLDQQRLNMLLSELVSLQRSNYRLTSKDRQKNSKEKVELRNKLFGKFLVLGLTLKFIRGDGSLVFFLRLNKESRNILSSSVYKQCLVGSSSSLAKRTVLWQRILRLEELEIDYEMLQKKA